MANSRRKGKEGELEWAKFLRAHGYDAHRGQQYKGGGDSPDVTGLPGIHQEVKRVEQFSLYSALDQSKRDSDDGEVPIVIHRRNRKPWVVVMDAEDFLEIYRKAYAVAEDDER